LARSALLAVLLAACCLLAVLLVACCLELEELELEAGGLCAA
jgi:hypothetical protein